MKEGDLCRCIKKFESVLPQELTLFEGDLFQILTKEDKLWAHGIGGGSKGKVPTSCLVKLETHENIPPYETHEKLFAVSSDFYGTEEGDLPLLKGTVVVGEVALDEAWWRGRCGGKTGVFPINFVWEIDTSILEDDQSLEKVVNKLGKVVRSFVPQLDEEIALYPGEVVRITHAVDKDWFRGECGGKIGIFHRNYVRILDEEESESSVPPPSHPVDAQTSVVLPTYVSSNAVAENSLNILSGPHASNISVRSDTVSSYNITTSQSDHNSTSPALSKISNEWKYSTEDNNDVDIYNDDYFRVNMPSLYKQSSSNEHSNLAISSKDSLNDAYSSIPNLDSSNMLNKDNSLSRTNTITREVDDYFNSRSPLRPSLSTNTNRGVSNTNRYDREVDKMLNVGYNEDNTGIKPYGKAAYDFTAQYPNELSFCKDEIVYLIKHIDSHWTMGRIGDDSGIFPSSYIDIIVDCVDNTMESFLLRPTSITDVPENEGFAVVEYNFSSDEQGDLSVRVGEKIKIIENIDDNWAIVNTISGERGMCPRNHFRLLPSKNVPDDSETSNISTIPDNLMSFNNDASENQSMRYSKDLEAIKELDEQFSKNFQNINLSTDKPNVTSQKSMPIGLVNESKLGEEEVTLRRQSLPKAIEMALKKRSEGNEDYSFLSKTSQPVGTYSGGVSSGSAEGVTAAPCSEVEQMEQQVSPESSDTGQPHSPTKKGRLSRQTAVGQDVTQSGGMPLHSDKEDVQAVSPPLPTLKTLHEGGRRAGSSEDDQQSEFPKDMKSSPAKIMAVTSDNAPLRPAPPPPQKSLSCDLNKVEAAAGEAENMQQKELVKFRKRKSIEKESKSTFYPVTDEASDAEVPAPSRSVEEEEVVEGELPSPQKLVLRKEVIQELVTTEHEYIHDLEAMVQVARVTASKAKECGIDLPVLLSNLDQVVVTAKSLLKALQRVSYEDDDEVTIGSVFVEEAQQLGEVYKVYCAHHTTVVEPLLSQYQGNAVKKRYLDLVLEELQQHKIQLLDMRSVLIKPVQRILKYPLFLDRLLTYTSASHPDYKMLQKATQSIANVAKLVNTHTKRMDVVRKYGHSSSSSQHVDDTFGAHIRKRLSLHSIAKKSARVTTRITASLGITTLNEDTRFSTLVGEYRQCMAAIKALSQHAQSVLTHTRERQHADLSLIEGLATVLLSERKNSNAKTFVALEKARTSSREVYIDSISSFETTMSSAVINPLKQIITMVSTTERLLAKRHDKMLDYNMAQQKMDRNKDPAKTRILEEEFVRVRSDYDALNEQLIDELPDFNTSASAILNNALLAYVSARTTLQGRLGSKFCSLKQDIGSSLDNSSDMKKAACAEISGLPFVPESFFSSYRNETATHSRRKKSSQSTPPIVRNQVTSRHQSEETQRKLIRKYQSRLDLLFVLKDNYYTTDTLHLSVNKGAVVACLKNKDPSGSSEQWYVDDGEHLGFIPSGILLPYNRGNGNTVTGATAAPSTTNRTVQLPSSSSSHQSDMRANPPKYEDIFPERVATQLNYTNDNLGSNQDNVQHPTSSQANDKTLNIYAEIGDSDHHYEDIDDENGNGDYDIVSPDTDEPNDDQLVFYYALYKFGGDSSSHQLSLYEGQVVLMLESPQREALPSARDWYYVENRDGEQGYVPASYLAKYR